MHCKEVCRNSMKIQDLTIVAFSKAPLIFPAIAFCLSSAAFFTSRKSICVTLWSGKSSSWCVKDMTTECGAKLLRNATTPSLHVNVVRSGGGTKTRWHRKEVKFFFGRVSLGKTGKLHLYYLVSNWHKIRYKNFLRKEEVCARNAWQFHFPIVPISQPDRQLSNASSGLLRLDSVRFLRTFRLPFG